MIGRSTRKETREVMRKMMTMKVTMMTSRSKTTPASIISPSFNRHEPVVEGKEKLLHTFRAGITGAYKPTPGSQKRRRGLMISSLIPRVEESRARVDR